MIVNEVTHACDLLWEPKRVRGIKFIGSERGRGGVRSIYKKAKEASKAVLSNRGVGRIEGAWEASGRYVLVIKRVSVSLVASQEHSRQGGEVGPEHPGGAERGRALPPHSVPRYGKNYFFHQPRFPSKSHIKKYRPSP